MLKKVNVHAALRETRSDVLGFELPCEPPGSVLQAALWAAKRTKLNCVGSARSPHRFFLYLIFGFVHVALASQQVRDLPNTMHSLCLMLNIFLIEHCVFCFYENRVAFFNFGEVWPAENEAKSKPRAAIILHNFFSRSRVSHIPTLP